MNQSPHVSLDGRESARPRRYRKISGPLCCLFTVNKTQRIGSGTTTTRGTSTIHWFVRQVAPGRFGVRSVDGRYLPWGKERIITAEKLFARYIPEVSLFEKAMLPAVQRWGYRMEEKDYGDIGSIRSKIRMDKANANALFNLAMDYVCAGKTQLGMDMANQLIQLESSFDGKNQHLFNRFGIALRKMGLHGAAVSSYRRALEYTANDDHLYYNLARAHYEQGQWWDCISALGKCFEFNPGLPVGRDLVELTIALSRNPALLGKYAKPPVPDGVVRRARLLAEAVEFVRPLETPVLSKRLEGQPVVPSTGPALSASLPRIFQNRRA